MKVLMVNTFHHQRGGDTTYVRSLTALLEGAGHAVVPLAMRHPDNDPSPWAGHFVTRVDLRQGGGGLRALHAAGRLAWSRAAIRACRALVAQERPQVAHLHHVHRHITPSVLVPLEEAGIPVVWTLHDYELVCPSGLLWSQGAPCERCRGHRYRAAVLHRCKRGRLGPSLLVALEKTAHRLRRVWERVDRFLCPSRHMVDALLRFGLPRERVYHLPNFLPAATAARPHEPGEGWLVAGRLAEEKGVDVAIAAARRLPGTPLWIAGAGPAEARLRRLAADLPHVHFLGHLPREALQDRLQRVRVVAVPSRWPENFPYAVLEAQAAGRAVVASRVGGIPEQIDHGVDGVLVPPGDDAALALAVGGLLGDPGRALALGEAARRRVRERLAPGPHLSRVLAHYEALAGARLRADR